jgi:hypothetical protein
MADTRANAEGDAAPAQPRPLHPPAGFGGGRRAADDAPARATIAPVSPSARRSPPPRLRFDAPSHTGPLRSLDTSKGTDDPSKRPMDGRRPSPVGDGRSRCEVKRSRSESKRSRSEVKRSPRVRRGSHFGTKRSSSVFKRSLVASRGSHATSQRGRSATKRSRQGRRQSRKPRNCCGRRDLRGRRVPRRLPAGRALLHSSGLRSHQRSHP